MMPMNAWQESNCWLSCMTLTGELRPLDVIQALEVENIESRPLWKPMHLQPLFKDYDFVGEGIAEQLFEDGVCLPSDTKLTYDDLERIVNIIKNIKR